MNFRGNFRLRLGAKSIVWSQIAAQLLFPIMTAFPAQAVQPKSQKEGDFLPYGDTMSSLASTVSSNGSDGLKAAAQNAATGAAASTVEEWLSNFGTAKVNLSVDNDGHWDQSSIDLLTPIYDNKKSVWFTQFGLRAPDGRVTGNFGTGVRTFYTENWMFGGNVFFDDDFTGKNRRVGFGAEAWTNYLKLSANTYVGTTDWHDSRDFDDYYEKPADGFDIRAEGYLPAYPQVGAKVMYEKYYGNKVALFDTDHLQSNPSAVTMGVSYTPVPLVSLAANYRKGQDSMDDAQFQVNVRYDFGHDWRYQVNPDNVRSMRTLAGSRYDLVERNNQIILQYKKKDDQGVSKLALQAVTDNSPADGLTQNTLQVIATNRDNVPVPNAPITWATTGGAKLDVPASVTNNQGIATVNLTNTTVETVQVTANSGAVSATLPSHFDTVTVSNLALAISKDGSIADGTTANAAIATVKDINNRPIANTKVSWAVTSPAVLKNADATTDANGQARTEFTSTQAGPVTLKISAGSMTAEQKGSFVSNNANAQITDFTVSTNNSPANGTTPNVALITVKDPNGNAISNATVAVTADKGTVAFAALKSARASGTSMQTDANGQLRFAFTDSVAEPVTLTATLDNGNTKSVLAQFTADTATAQVQDLKVTKDKSAANGSTANTAEVYVKDANGNAVSGAQVSWSADKSTVTFASSAVTDTTGKTTVQFTDSVAESVTIKAQVSNGSNMTANSSFIADATTAQLQNLLVTKDGSAANGNDANTAEVYVKDATGNPLQNEDVTWSADKTGITFVPGGKTDAAGKTTVSYTSTVAQNLQLTAKLQNGNQQNVSSLFIADTASERIATYTVTTGALANGSATNTASVTVTDANNNPVQNVAINWSTDGAATLSSASGKTDSAGKASITLTDLKAEAVNVTVKLDSGVSQTKSTEFVADSSTAKIGAFTVTTGAIADGSTTNSGTISIVDANNNPVSNATVTWSITGSAKVAASSNTDASGNATITVTDTKAEDVTLTATVNGVSQGKPMTFVADASKAIIQTLILDTNNSVANGSASNKAVATVVDENGNPVANQTITWKSDRFTTTLTPSGVTDADGKASMTFTDTKAEPVLITATLSNGNSKSVNGAFIADSTTATVSLITVNPDNSLADGVAANVAKATVHDANGNTVSGEQITWTADRSSVVLTPSGATDTAGNASVSFTDTIGGSVNITATLANGNSLSKAANFQSEHVSSLNSDLTTQEANGNDVITFTARLTSSSGQAIANSGVEFSLSGVGTLSSTDVTTDANGQAQVTLKSTAEGDATVTAKSKVNSSDTGQSRTVTFTMKHITTLSANGHTFATSTGFPSIGFPGATFQALIDNNAANNSDYIWSTNQSWATVDSSGIVTFNAKPGTSTNALTISARPKAGGTVQSYTFFVKRWFVSAGQATGDQTAPDGICSGMGMSVPSYTVMSNSGVGGYADRGVIGTLFGEWGNMNAYSSFPTPGSEGAGWTAEQGRNSRTYFFWGSGEVYDNAHNNVAMDVTCTTTI
ncbi:TPA: Ig-like domain-containing protein [Klebsiella aerogenes]